MGKKILIVDDEYQIREIISTLLEEHGYTAIQAKNGEEAKNIIKEDPPDMIILDVLMPEKSGIKLYRELKTTDSLLKIPVMICSGIAKRTFMRTHGTPPEGEGPGIPEPDAYMEKPVKPELLVRTVKGLIG
ncbi:MAG: response regulator [Deltaproteobacteria bacterium]|nr:response regulator [Deltaproteobacteria bacterium]MBW2137062.1 response regulator [Deltaproteobacteria bacterium]